MPLCLIVQSTGGKSGVAASDNNANAIYMSAPPPFQLGDPRNYAHRHVESDDSFRFVHLERERHGEVPFLTDEYLGTPVPICDVSTEQCLSELDHGKIDFLFHSAFCGSTMLTRALDRPGMAMGLSEPLTINDVVGFRRRGADPRAVARTADAAMRLLARPFGPNEATIVKPSNIINPLAELLLAMRPQSKAVFLYAPLETFLISVARKGLHCRLWVRELLEGYLREGFVDLGFEPKDFFRQSDLQVAAVGWLAQHAYFAKLAQKLGQGRIATLDADRMTDDPATAIGAVLAHYNLPNDAQIVSEIVNGPAFAKHSKSGAAFTPETRKAEYADARATHAQEIDMVLVWTKAVAETADVSMDAPFGLV
jgi:hypothetical protein